MKKGIRRCRDFMPSVQAGYSGRGWETSIQKLGFLPEAQNDMIFSIICEELGLVGAGLILLSVPAHDLEVLRDRRHMREICLGALIACGGHGAHDDPGDPKYCRGDQYHPQYRDHAAVYQLRRYLGCVPSDGNGACAECIKSDRMKKITGKTKKVKSETCKAIKIL